MHTICYLSKRNAKFISTASLALTCGLAQSALIVNTGTPVGTDAIALFNSGGSNLSFLGGSFAVGSNQTITEVEGYIGTYSDGDMILALWSGAPSALAQPLFTATRSFSVEAEAWQAFSGLSWTIGSGNYSVTFSPIEVYGGFMRSGPPVPLAQYYGYFPPAFGPDWVATGNTYGVRVTAVPELPASLLLIAGLCCLAKTIQRNGRLASVDRHVA